MKKRFFLTLLLTVFTVAVLFADPGPLPCGGTDPDDVSACPIDTWVVLLALGAAVFAYVHLSRKQKAAIKAA